MYGDVRRQHHLKMMNASPFRRVVLQRYLRHPRAPRCASVGIFAAHSEWCEKRPVRAGRFHYGGASCGVLSKSLSFFAHARRVARILRHPRAPRCASVGIFAAHSEWCEKRPVCAGRFLPDGVVPGAPREASRVCGTLSLWRRIVRRTFEVIELLRSRAPVAVPAIYSEQHKKRPT